MQAQARRCMVLAVLLLGGCAEEEDGLADRLIGPPRPAAEQAALLSGGPDELVDTRRPDRIDATLVEAPELFSETAVALWDGRPTLAGLWIAHPAATMALRVRMTNPRTGTMIDGALLPGTPMAERDILISAEAADALGLRPLVPAQIELVAVDRDVARGPEPDRYASAPPPQPRAEPAAAPAGSALPGEGAGAVVPVLVPDTAMPPAEYPAQVAEPTLAEPVQRAQTASVPAVVNEATAPASSELAERRAALAQGARPPAPAVVTEAATEAAPAAAVEGDAAPPAAAAAVAEPDRAQPLAAGADATYRPAVTQTAAPARAETDAATASAVVTDAPPAEAEATAAIADGLPYIQAGLFAEREQAADLVRALARLGIPARNLAATVDGEAVSRVVAGPFATEQARGRALSQINGLGLAGAQPTSG